jgi:hypothetical protein
MGVGPRKPTMSDKHSHPAPAFPAGVSFAKGGTLPPPLPLGFSREGTSGFTSPGGLSSTAGYGSSGVAAAAAAFRVGNAFTGRPQPSAAASSTAAGGINVMPFVPQQQQQQQQQQTRLHQRTQRSIGGALSHTSSASTLAAAATPFVSQLGSRPGSAAPTAGGWSSLPLPQMLQHRQLGSLTGTGLVVLSASSSQLPPHVLLTHELLTHVLLTHDLLTHELITHDLLTHDLFTRVLLTHELLTHVLLNHVLLTHSGAA